MQRQSQFGDEWVCRVKVTHFNAGSTRQRIKGSLRGARFTKTMRISADIQLLPEAYQLKRRNMTLIQPNSDRSFPSLSFLDIEFGRLVS